MQIPANISLKQEGQYCIHCFSQKVEKTDRDGLTYYHCHSCGQIAERSLVIDNSIVWWIDKKTNEYWHESVGIFVFNFENKALFFERTIYPFAFTIPAGHLDVGEIADVAVKRELKEETKIESDNVKLFSTEDVSGDKCRRGADHHKWHLYVAQIENIGNIKINDEGIKPVWLTFDEALGKKLVYPVRYFIEKYGEKLLKSAQIVEI
ncbi:TPA: NUDIX domain-containing protein [Candidatus Falkowbacteria bacterium]|nr:MAG: NUDIX hydrolase [Candidatus Falkowbacteria bacterium GW2011_GWF2_43_32]HBA36362.1 NUDIX domain-containing protein [Candidatus Falkowbacteria bacterium]